MAERMDGIESRATQKRIGQRSTRRVLVRRKGGEVRKGEGGGKYGAVCNDRYDELREEDRMDRERREGGLTVKKCVGTQTQFQR